MKSKIARRTRIPLGTFRDWIEYRLIAGLVFLAAFGIVVLSFAISFSIGFSNCWIALAVLPFILDECSHSLAYGYADENGMTFRIRFRKHHVPWKNILRVYWTRRLPGNLTVMLLEPPGRLRMVEFHEITDLWQLRAIERRFAMH